MRRDDVCVIGAGPYGLTAAAHLRAAGLKVRVFGEVMSFWRAMPSGMLLRSTREGISLSDPAHSLSLGDYEQACDAPLVTPVPRADFIRYVEWFQRSAVPEIDARTVSAVERIDGGFRLTLDDGESFFASRVVVAIGLSAFKRRLPVFDELPYEIARHSFDERDCSEHRDKEVLIVGSGQSSLETAAALTQHGAKRVEIVSRCDRVFWLAQSDHINRERGLWSHVLYPPGAIGPPGINWVVQLPWLYRSLPGSARRMVFNRAVRPAASGRLKAEIEQVELTFNRSVTAAQRDGKRIQITLDDGSTRTVDHVVQGTGFEIDVHRFGFLSPEIVRALRTIGGQPKLGNGFESSIPGLHFLGAASDLSFGPLMRAIAGTSFTAEALTKRALSRAPKPEEPVTWSRALDMLGQGVSLVPTLAGPSTTAAAMVGLFGPALGADTGIIDAGMPEIEVTKV
jgi:hypothetical protein